MLTNTGDLKRSIIVLYAKAGILHSFVQERKSMEALANQIGTSRSTRRRSLRTVKLMIDGENNLHMSMSMAPDSSPQQPQEVQQPQCAAAAMMHGISMAPASSLHGGCPPIQEHQEYGLPRAPPSMMPTQRDVITPNPRLSNSSESMGSQYSILCSGSKPSCDVHSSLQHDAESTLSIVWQARSTTASRFHHGSQPQHCVLLRTSGSYRSIARNLHMSLHAAVYGHKAFRRKSRMNRRRFTNGSKA